MVLSRTRNREEAHLWAVSQTLRSRGIPVLLPSMRSVSSGYSSLD